MRNLATTFAIALFLGGSPLALATEATPPGATAPTTLPSNATGGTTGQSTNTTTVPGTSNARSGASAMSETQIKQKLQTEGYSNITGLRQEKGTWVGKAKKDGKEITVDVDQSGRVMAK